MTTSTGMECSISIRSIKCDGCGSCIEICPENAISIHDPSFVDQEKCSCCGKCVEVCDARALAMKNSGML